jgi:outer membrane biosynthesis protein TonB
LPRRTLALAVAGIAALALLLGVGVGGVLLVAGRSTETALPLPVTTTPVIGTAPIAAPPVTAVAAPPTSVPVPTTIVMAPPATGIPVPPTTVAASTSAPATPVAVTVATPPETPVAVAPQPEPQPEPEPEPVAQTPTPRGSRPTRGARPTREPATTGITSAQARITTAYNAGDFDGAAAIARDAARHTTGADQRTLETLANNIDSFAGLYPRIRGAGEALGPVASTVPIALRLDRQIVSGGHYAREIQPRFVRFLVTQARGQISSAPQTACPRVRDALELDGGNTDALALSRQCETAAARMLADAQSHERSDAAGAQRSYLTIQQMVPRTSATFRTAGERLTSLRSTATHARPVDEDE